MEMGLGQMPNQFAVRPPVVQTEESKQVQVPPVAPHKTEWADISEYEELNDWYFLIVAVLVVEVVTLAAIRFFPSFFGKAVNVWYNRFNLNAILSDVLIILLGFGLARYAYSEWIYPKYDWNPLYFTGLSVVIQVVHDALFYLGIVTQIPVGSNGIIDLLKGYGQEVGAKAILADSVMMTGTSLLAMALKTVAPHIVLFVGLLSAYAVPYVLAKKNEYSNIV
jgi:hypothetical protein